jgi:hypothetical protein
MYLLVHLAGSGVSCPDRRVYDRGVMPSPICMVNVGFFNELVVSGQKLQY